MGKSRFVEEFTELDVYCRASSVARSIFVLSKNLPPVENSLRGQLLRASRSIGAQIAEAWGKRPYPRHFIAKLTDADAEQREVRHWVNVALDCGYVRKEDAETIFEQLSEVSRMLIAMRNKADAFQTCKPERE